ncbi:CHRD domain-containing protein [Lottiidibacillus patelloidae]|uniref:CHRD domain-containing protein n=1 Tax=Lottiidibacillus patelloidae TaxID=2670334 RepID=A0A263BR33_9BACI|nr:CHRD domain-containing protein [Lottiidibacillus patelloidae]OZM56163.1 CHRD domain-containing protein [Lottiidibacillus patelloidae]
MSEFFVARLRGRNEVPPVRSNAFGIAKFVTNKKKTKLKFFLEVNNIRDLVQAHIHFGERDENGPVLAFLFGADVATLAEQEGISTRQGVVQGIIKDEDIVDNNVGIDSVKELIKAMEKGNTYVNVHTEQNPGGEIRGQIKKIHPIW